MRNKAKEDCCACEGACMMEMHGSMQVTEQLTFRREVLVVYFLCSPEAEK